MPVRNLPLAAIAASLCTVPVHAQDAAVPGEAEDGGDIIVTGLPLPPAQGAYGGVAIDGDQLGATASGRLEEALARIPGFQQFRRSDSRSANPSAQGITLRGIGGNATSRTLLLLDGVPQADAFFGFIPFSALPAEALAGARVTRGSGVGPFGSGAVAGTIELFSLPPGERAPLSAALALGSRDAREASIGIAVPLGAGHVAIDVGHEAGDGFFTTPAQQRVAASVPARYRSTRAVLSAAAPLGETGTLSARIAAFTDDRTLRFAGADSSAEGIDASVRLLLRGQWQAELLGWAQMRDFSTVVVSAATFRPTLDQRDTPTTGWGGKIELRPPSAAGRLLRFGADVRGADGIAIEDALAASGARTLTRRAGGRSLVAGAFLEADWVNGPVALTGGARVDHWRQEGGFQQEFRADGTVAADNRFAVQSGTPLSLRGAASWDMADGLALRASAYTGFRIPTLNELYRGFTVFPVVTRANAALAPERIEGVEAAIEWQPVDGLTLGVTLFDNRLERAIANVTIGPNLRQRRNVGAIAARGIEGELRWRSGPWRVEAGWAFSNAEVRAGSDPAAAPLAGLEPAQSPRHAGGVTLGWEQDGWLASAMVRHVGRQFEDDRNVDVLPAATTLDALVRAPLGRGLQLVLRAENLADERVVTRNVAGSLDLGAPRTFWLGLRWTRE
jgi:outer membrane receptor protein involved in Fe transport